MSGEKIRVEYLDEGSYETWNRLLADSPQGTIYSSPEYLDALCEATGGAFRLLAVLRGTELVGGLGVYQEATPVGLKLSGRYLLYFNSLLLRNYETRYPSRQTARTLETLRAIEQAISEKRFARVRISNHWSVDDVRPFLVQGWKATPTYTYVADLTDMDKLARSVDRNYQRLINRCRDTDLEFVEDDDFASLYRLHTATHVRKGSPVYLDESPFTRYFQRLRALHLCRLDHLRTPEGRSVAAQLTLLGPYPTAHTVCAGADPEFMQLGTTPYLRWATFEALADQGYQGNDLTDAALNSVTRFKSQLGADLKMSLTLSKRDRPTMAAVSASRRLASRIRSSVRGLESTGAQ